MLNYRRPQGLTLNHPELDWKFLDSETGRVSRRMSYYGQYGQYGQYGGCPFAETQTANFTIDSPANTNSPSSATISVTLTVQAPANQPPTGSEWKLELAAFPAAVLASAGSFTPTAAQVSAGSLPGLGSGGAAAPATWMDGSNTLSSVDASTYTYTFTDFPSSSSVFLFAVWTIDAEGCATPVFGAPFNFECPTAEAITATSPATAVTFVPPNSPANTQVLGWSIDMTTPSAMLALGQAWVAQSTVWETSNVTGFDGTASGMDVFMGQLTWADGSKSMRVQSASGSVQLDSIPVSGSTSVTVGGMALGTSYTVYSAFGNFNTSCTSQASNPVVVDTTCATVVGSAFSSWTVPATVSSTRPREVTIDGGVLSPGGTWNLLPAAMEYMAIYTKSDYDTWKANTNGGQSASLVNILSNTGPTMHGVMALGTSTNYTFRSLQPQTAYVAVGAGALVASGLTEGTISTCPLASVELEFTTPSACPTVTATTFTVDSAAPYVSRLDLALAWDMDPVDKDYNGAVTGNVKVYSRVADSGTAPTGDELAASNTQTWDIAPGALTIGSGGFTYKSLTKGTSYSTYTMVEYDATGMFDVSGDYSLIKCRSAVWSRSTTTADCDASTMVTVMATQGNAPGVLDIATASSAALRHGETTGVQANVYVFDADKVDLWAATNNGGVNPLASGGSQVDFDTAASGDLAAALAWSSTGQGVHSSSHDYNATTTAIDAGARFYTVARYYTDECWVQSGFSTERTPEPAQVFVALSSDKYISGSLTNDAIVTVTATFSVAGGAAYTHAWGLDNSNWRVTVDGNPVTPTSLVPSVGAAGDVSTTVMTLNLPPPLQVSVVRVHFVNKTTSGGPRTLVDSSEFRVTYTPPPIVISSNRGVSGAEWPAEFISFTVTFNTAEAVTGFSEAAFNLGKPAAMSVLTTYSVLSTNSFKLTVQVLTSTAGDITVQVMDSQTGVTPSPAASEVFVIKYAPPKPTLRASVSSTTNQPTFAVTATFSTPVSNVQLSTFGFESRLADSSLDSTATAVLRPLSSGVTEAASWVVDVTLLTRADATVSFTVVTATPSVTPRTGLGTALVVQYRVPTVALSATGIDSNSRFFKSSVVITATFSSTVSGVNNAADFGLSSTPATAWTSAVVSAGNGANQWLLTVVLPPRPTGSVTLSCSIANNHDTLTPPVKGVSAPFTVHYYPPRLTFVGGTTLTSTATTFSVPVVFKYGPTSTASNSAVTGVRKEAFSVSGITSGLAVSVTGVTRGTSCAAAPAACDAYTVAVAVAQPITTADSFGLTVAFEADAKRISPPNANGETLTVSFTPTQVGFTLRDATSNAIVTASALTNSFNIGVDFTSGGSPVTTRPTGWTSAALQLQLGSYISTDAIAVTGSPVAAGGVLALDMKSGSLAGRMSKWGGYIDFVETASVPQLATATNVPLTYTCATCGVDLVFRSTDSIQLSASTYGVTPGSVSSDSLSFSWWNAATPTTVDTTSGSTKTIGQLAAGSHSYVVRVSLDANRFYEVTLRLKVYSITWNAAAQDTSVVRYSGSSTTVGWTSVLPTQTPITITLENAEGVVRVTKSLAAAGATGSTTIQIPATLLSGSYQLRVKTSATAALKGANGQKRVEDVTTVAVINAFAYNVGDWGPCSSLCGAGTRERSVDCVDESGTVPTVVSDSICTALGLTKDATLGECPSLPACTAPTWVFSAWGACSKSQCGYGTQTRTATCFNVDSTTVTDATEAAQVCGALTSADTSRGCNEFDCPTYSWVSFAYGRCDAKCGSGNQRRFVACKQDNVFKYAADSFCASAGDKPATTRACADLRPCSQPFWQVSQYSNCDAQCGGGSSTATVTCMASDGVVASSESVCSDAGTKPPVTRTCNTAPCFSTQTGPFTECSLTCGGGVRTRQVACLNRQGASVPASSCTGAGIIMPTASKACNTQECPKLNFCSDDEKCSGHGSCDSTLTPDGAVIAGACVCGNQWQGTHCEVAKSCPAGSTVMDKDGACCAGDLNADGTCCESGNHALDGACCPASAPHVNGCGLCTADETTVMQLDSNSKCCAASAIAGGVCCDGEVDECGECQGTGDCPRKIGLVLSVPDVSTAEDLFASGWVQTLIDDLRTKLNLPADAIVDVQIEVTGGARRISMRLETRSGRLLVCCVVVVVRVIQLSTLCVSRLSRFGPSPLVSQASTSFSTAISVIPGATVLDAAIMGDLTSVAPGLDVGAGAIASTTPAEVAPVCGNARCEVGETCGTTDDDCCIRDCPVRHIECPTTEGKPTCSGRGTCEYATGTCQCLPGYAGSKCALCAAGYVSASGTCSRISFVATSSNTTDPGTGSGSGTSALDLLRSLSGAAIGILTIFVIIAFVAIIMLCKWMLADMYVKEDAPEDDLDALAAATLAGGPGSGISIAPNAYGSSGDMLAQSHDAGVLAGALGTSAYAQPVAELEDGSSHDVAGFSANRVRSFRSLQGGAGLGGATGQRAGQLAPMSGRGIAE